MFCTESCWANIDFFRFHSAVWIDWFWARAFGRRWLCGVAGSWQGCPCLAQQCPVYPCRPQQHAGGTGSSNPTLHSTPPCTGLRVTSPSLHLSWSSQVDLGGLGHTADRKSRQNTGKPFISYCVSTWVQFIPAAQARCVLRVLGAVPTPWARGGGGTLASALAPPPLGPETLRKLRQRNKKAERKFGLIPPKAGDHL